MLHRNKDIFEAAVPVGNLHRIISAHTIDLMQ